MAVNILGTVAAEKDKTSGAWNFPSVQSFTSCVEPLSTSFFFQHDRWRKLHQFTEDGSFFKIDIETPSYTDTIYIYIFKYVYWFCFPKEM